MRRRVSRARSKSSQGLSFNAFSASIRHGVRLLVCLPTVIVTDRVRSHDGPERRAAVFTWLAGTPTAWSRALAASSLARSGAN